MAGIGEADLKVGDRVVYPNQGVCRVVGTTELEIAGQRETFVKLAREEDAATVMVPRGRLGKVGLRRIADDSDLKKVFAYLGAPFEGPELDWKARARSHGERMSVGGLIDLAQVVKGLATLADLRPLPPKERELYDNARHLLVSELAAAAGLPEASAEDAVDLALFPPGVQRKKPELKIALANEDGLDLGDDLDLSAGIEGAAATVRDVEGGEESEEANAEAETAEPEEEAPPAVEKPKRGRKPKEGGLGTEKPRPKASAATEEKKRKPGKHPRAAKEARAKTPRARPQPAGKKPRAAAKPKASKAKK
jgi:RNA polymerase-interacting CarD/CdnL/TRCF family regulator